MRNEKGVTLFISVVIMSILLFISFAVINITLKNSLFATSGRDSQFAFYAADSGLECAIYWDNKYDPSKFATSTSGSSIDCADSTIAAGQVPHGTTTPNRIGGGGDSEPTSVFGFLIEPSATAGPCAIVTVTKYYEDKSSPLDGYKETLMTYIKSRGYNTCDMNNPRRLERGVETTY